METLSDEIEYELGRAIFDLIDVKWFIKKELEDIEQVIVTEEQLDIYFPKGDKRRGQVLALLGIINAKIRERIKKRAGHKLE